MKIFETLDNKDSGSVIQSVHYRNIPSGFSGNIMYYSIDKKFVNGFKYINGKIIGTYSFANTVNEISKFSTQLHTTGYDYVCVYTYSQNYFNGEAGAVYDEHYDCGYVYTNTGPTLLTLSGDDRGGFSGDNENPGGGFGGGGSSDESPAIPIITNNVKDSCLKAMVNATINKNIKSEVNLLIQDVFGSSSKLNLSFVDVVTLSPGIEGFTNPPHGPDANGNLNVEIQLNKNSLPNYSQEFIATVIMHEALHAWMLAYNINPASQHNLMVKYIDQMGKLLQRMFGDGSVPGGLSDNDARNLALGGLQGTNEFKTLIATDLQLLGSFEAIELAFSVGSRGKRCL